MSKQEKPLYTLIPLDDFKAVMGIDDRDDKIARFCLVTSTFSIEQYCKRRLLRKKHFEQVECVPSGRARAEGLYGGYSAASVYTGDLIIPLKEYPVTNLLAVYAISSKNRTGEIVEPEFYNVIPDCGTSEDIPFCLSLSPALQRYRGLTAFKAVYWAGYAHNKVPADLATACLELASWNMNRYRGRRIGMTGTVRGNGRDGEHFEMSMPENVRSLLEPYRRKVI
ncbi:MAG: hypothetical protein LBU88_08570 [Treponema sp.]|jgi:hypothetical protein|nr:hypothetical protein [Treponema sp.]